MVVPDSNFRPNESRSLWIQGKIDEELVGRIAPTIATFRAQSSDPITLYINSNGGSTRSAETIYCLLRTVDLNGNKPRLITVAVGNARSAAADILSLGNYAYSYPGAAIHFHGARMGSVSNVTVEDSYELANSLGETNNVAAMKLANASIQRLVLRYAILSKDFDSYRQDTKKASLTDIECFVGLLQAKNPSESVWRVTKGSLKKCMLINSMSDYIAQRVKEPKKKLPSVQVDATIFKHVLNFELQANKLDDWELDAEGI